MPTIDKTKTASKSEANEAAADKSNKTEDKKKKAAAAPKAKPFLDRVTLAADLVLKQEATDEDIIAKVNEKFDDYPGSPALFNQREMGRVRWMLRNDKLTTRKLEKDQPFSRLFVHPETKKLVERAEMPKKKSASKKPAKEDDILNNVAGVNVHDEKPAEKTAKKESKAEALKKKIKKTKK